MVLLLAAALWTALQGRESPLRRERLKPFINLLPAFQDGEFVRTTERIALGGPRGQRQTEEVERRRFMGAEGVLSRPDGDPPYAWLVGHRPTFRLDILEVEDRSLIFFMANAISRTQNFAVFFNGNVVGSGTLPAEERQVRLSFSVPALMQNRGSNLVMLAFQDVEVRKLMGEPRLPIAAVINRVHFERVGTEGVDRPPPKAGVFPDDRGKPSLVLPGGTVVQLGLDRPTEDRLGLRLRIEDAGVPFEVSILQDMKPRRTLFTGDGGDEGQMDLDLTPWAAAPMLLEIWAREGAGVLKIDAAHLLGGADLLEEDTSANASLGRRVEALENPSFLVIVLDAMARRHSSAFGYERETTPQLAALASHSLVFPGATAPASYTLSSVATLLTGAFPRTHGVTFLPADGMGASLPEHLPRVAERLKNAGWKTGGFVTNPNAGSRFGFGEGFEEWVDLFDEPGLFHEGVEGRHLLPRLTSFLERAEEEPFFAYVHVFEPHAPYVAPQDLLDVFVRPYEGGVSGDRQWLDGFRRGGRSVGVDGWNHLTDLYDARIALADRVLGELLAILQRSGRDEETVILVVSDHGEAVGEHHSAEHGDHVYAEQLEVPMVLHVPGLPPGEIHGAVSLADVAPTLLGLAGLAVPSEMDGVDLLASSVPENRPLLARSYGRLPAISWARGRYKLIVDLGTRRRYLFDVIDDPMETRDLSLLHPATMAVLYQELLQALCATEGAGAPLVAVPQEDLERMAELGYAVGGEEGSAPVDGEEICDLLRSLRRRL
ncbi:MAG: sulfatase [Planctomycetota bacterium]|nr:sulfatase [Planctomycetota bacterium]